MNQHSLTTAAFTAATTDIITSAAHGLKNGDAVVLTTTNTLPAGLATSTVYYVIEAATDTFKLSALPVNWYTTGEANPVPPAVDVTDTGTGTHTFTMHDIGRNIYCRDFRHAVLSVHTASSANLTLKFQKSIGDSIANPYDCPDFSAAVSKDNSWEYIGSVEENTAIAYDGDVGFVVAGTDDHKHFRINIDGMDWLNCILTAWSAGNVTVRVLLFNP